ncbi:MAG: hypothetical protein HQL22_01575 [Candidatus Omnitrophica bacterium]|nr:hypothetical protein [Candidatus Omnitrophota bacterium]
MRYLFLFSFLFLITTQAMAAKIEYELLADGTMVGYRVNEAGSNQQSPASDKGKVSAAKDREMPVTPAEKVPAALAITPIVNEHADQRPHPDFSDAPEHPVAVNPYSTGATTKWPVPAWVPQDVSERLVYGDQPSMQPRLFEFSIAPETYYYRYKETENGQRLMQNTGTFFGLNSALAWNLMTPVYVPDTFRLEGRLAAGLVKYEGLLADTDTGDIVGTETATNIKDWVGELRALVSKRVPIGDNVQVAPYSGVGYRYLKDAHGSIPPMNSDGMNVLSGYDRESNYFYIPIGADIKLQCKNGWGLGLNLEYDHLIEGKQRSHLEQLKDTNGTTYGFSTVENTQKKGFGVRGSVKISKELANNKLSIYAEPYYRYWSIDQSDLQPTSGTLGGKPKNDSWYEPKNETQEVGLQAGVIF